MKKIEITTPQNVTVQYQLGTVWERGLALALDVLIMVAGYFLLLGLLLFLIPGYIKVAAYFTLAPLIIFYTLAFELFNNGQSPGKMALRLRVIRLDGKRPGFVDYLMRWSFRALEIYFSFGAVAIIAIISSAYNQRLGDILANTVVVSIGKHDRIAISTLMKLDQLEKHKVTYPQVIKLPEEALMIVKETLHRHSRFNNEAHEKSLNLLADQLQKQLGIKAKTDKRKFLQTLLQDYVVLTR